MHHGQGRAFELFYCPRLAAQAPLVGPGDQDEDGGDGQGHQRQLPVDARRDVDHPGQGEGRADEGHEAVDGNGLDGRGIVLDAVGGIGRALRVVVHEREALDVAEELTPEAQQ